MKSYKDRVLEAVKTIIILHQKIVNKTCEGLPETYQGCPLCRVYGVTGVNSEEETCSGCPLSEGRAGENGCQNFSTYPYNSNAYRDEDDDRPPIPRDRRTKIEISADRILFWKKVKPILENTSKERFTPNGWTFFYELERWW